MYVNMTMKIAILVQHGLRSIPKPAPSELRIKRMNRFASGFDVPLDSRFTSNFNNIALELPLDSRFTNNFTFKARAGISVVSGTSPSI